MTGRAVVERAGALWNDHDREGFIACFAEDCEFNVPRRPGTGRAAVAAWWDFNATAFGTGRVRVELLVESGETVAVEAVFEGTHTGPLPAVGSRREIPATGKTLVLPYAALYTVRDGLIVSGRAYWDGIEALDQLGQSRRSSAPRHAHVPLQCRAGRDHSLPDETEPAAPGRGERDDSSGHTPSVVRRQDGVHDTNPTNHARRDASGGAAAGQRPQKDVVFGKPAQDAVQSRVRDEGCDGDRRRRRGAHAGSPPPPLADGRCLPSQAVGQLLRVEVEALQQVGVALRVDLLGQFRVCPRSSLGAAGAPDPLHDHALGNLHAVGYPSTSSRQPRRVQAWVTTSTCRRAAVARGASRGWTCGWITMLGPVISWVICPGQREGLYEVTVSAAGVPGGGDLTAGDTIAVLDMGRA
jgi:ketosteroid isomerase-like protein